MKKEDFSLDALFAGCVVYLTGKSLTKKFNPFFGVDVITIRRYVFRKKLVRFYIKKLFSS